MALHHQQLEAIGQRAIQDVIYLLVWFRPGPRSSFPLRFFLGHPHLRILAGPRCACCRRTVCVDPLPLRWKLSGCRCAWRFLGGGGEARHRKPSSAGTLSRGLPLSAGVLCRCGGGGPRDTRSTQFQGIRLCQFRFVGVLFLCSRRCRLRFVGVLFLCSRRCCCRSRLFLLLGCVLALC